MTLDSLAILSHLQALERQLAEAPRHDQALRAARAGDRQAAQRAASQAERHVRAMAITVGQLKAEVVSADDLGAALESLSELALRAARMVVLAELETLRVLVGEHGSSRLLSWGRFRDIEDLTDCVRAELDRIARLGGADRDRSRTERPAYRVALQTAHAAMRKLGTASEVARFLWEGRRRADWPALRAVCIRISAALTLRLDVEPDLPFVVHRQPGAERGHGAGVVIRDRTTCAADGVRAQPSDRIEPFEAAIAEVAACMRSLSSAIAELAFADAARLRGTLARALSRAEALAALLPVGMRRAAALHKLGAMRGVANDLLPIAPVLSATAIAAMEAGDRSL